MVSAVQMNGKSSCFDILFSDANYSFLTVFLGTKALREFSLKQNAQSGGNVHVGQLRIAVVHAHPLERYPPATNAIDFFGSRQRLEVLVVSVEAPSNISVYLNSACQIHRIPFRDPNAGSVRNAVRGFHWHWKAAKLVASWKPDVIFYWDPQSALACYLCLRLMGCKAALFVHHHEYHAPDDFLRVGMRIARIGHYFERRSLFTRARWVSQTNGERMRLLRLDVPGLTDEQTRVMPNYPPKAWIEQCRSDRKNRQGDTLRLVYVGSLSLEDTFIGPLVNWLVAHPDAGLTLDIFTNNCKQQTLQFLRAAAGTTVRLHESGVDYQQIPDVLADFDVGVVLYRCNTTNYVYNASNKLFEYLMCGLDVWYPPTMLGVKPYARDDAWPRVIEVDFDHMDQLSLTTLRSRESLPHVPWVESCESQLEILEAEMRACL